MRFARVDETICRDRRISNAQFRVLVGLLLHANRDGYCNPSVRVMAGELGRTRPTIRHHLKALVELGIITRDPQPRKDGSRGANRYRILYIAGHEADPAPADRAAAQHFAPGESLPDAATVAADQRPPSGVTHPALLLPFDGGRQRTASRPPRRHHQRARASPNTIATSSQATDFGHHQRARASPNLIAQAALAVMRDG